MSTYPENFKPNKEVPLQSWLFGHRVQPGQTKYEYLIEFLQVALARKENTTWHRQYDGMFPVDESVGLDGFQYFPKSRIGLKRFVFFPKSKLDGKAKVDEDAYAACVVALTTNMTGGNAVAKKETISIIQNLMNGFCAVNQNRSWFDQNMLPVCPEVILPEGMGIKKWRQELKSSFAPGELDVDYKFDFHKYTYMCRGGEVYYLHLLSAINEHPQYKDIIEQRLNKMVTSFPQFSYLCSFVQETWETHMEYTEIEKNEAERRALKKDLGAIPTRFSARNYFTLYELTNLLNSKAHPFEKMEILSNGIILQIMRMMYIAASTENDSNCWVIDVNCKGFNNSEAKKTAITAFKHNEEVISDYLYTGYDLFVDKLADKYRSDIQSAIRNAAEDSYKLFRKMGKMIGIIIPNTGNGMRFSLSEDIIKFLVLSIIPPQCMITLDEFVAKLHKHYGMVIGPEQFKFEMEKGSVKATGDLSFLNENLKAFSQKLKDCGFLRDLSDATAIVENPYESEAAER